MYPNLSNSMPPHLNQAPWPPKPSRGKANHYVCWYFIYRRSRAYE